LKYTPGSVPIVLNPARGTGCTNHGQCDPGQYCFSCSKCQGNCAICTQGGVTMSGSCGPVANCVINGDSINGVCPASA
jgi:hypothetical protein